MKFGIGQPVRRTEDMRLVTGRGCYVDDIVLPDMVFGYVLRSPHAHAAIRSLDPGAARDMPGVLAVLTGEDAVRDGIPTIPCLAHINVKAGTEQRFPARPVLAVDRVRHVGDAVAFVIAESMDAARDAAEAIEIDYDPLPAVADMTEARDPDAATVWSEAPGNVAFEWEDGDADATEAAFARAAHIVSIDLRNNRLVANSMETRGVIGGFDAASGDYTLHASTQGSHLIKEILCTHILKDTPPDRVRVVTPDVGGGFGMKIFLYPEMVLALWAARRIGRPVKWVADRAEAFLADAQGRDNVTRAELALDDDGRFLAVRVATLANMGAYLSNFGPYIPTISGKGMHVGVYAIPAAQVTVTGVFTNTVPVDAYRGAGRPEASYMIERLVDKAGRVTGLGPVEIRLRNFIPAEAMPYRTALGLTYDSGDFAGTLREALLDADYDGFPARRRDASSRGLRRGIGISYYVEVCGAAPGVPAMVRFEPGDSVTLIVGTQSNGQGHETAYAQIAADTLGIPFERIRVRQGDTRMLARGSYTGGSRSIPVGGVAVRVAGEDAVAKARVAAADLLEAAATDIDYVEGRFVVAGTDRSIGIFEVAAAMREGTKLPTGIAEDLFGAGEFVPTAPTFPNGCHVCEVEIEPETGSVRIDRYTIVDDFGRVLNPMLLRGQVHGGVAQGIGQALCEDTVYDEGGQLLSGSFMDYAMPRADMFPPIAFRYNEIPCRTNPLGVKGCGEAGAIGAPPAVMNAVIDALDGREIDMPATPHRVWGTIRAGAV